MRQLPLQQIRQLCCAPIKGGQFAASCSSSRQTLSIRRNYARQSSLRIVAQARKSLMLRELERNKAEAKEDQEDSQLPSVSNLQWDSPLDIVRYPDPRLRAKNAKIAVFDESLKQLAAEMFEIMYRDQGVGLAAPQVGVNVRLMVYNPEGKKGEGQEWILVNPRIVSTGRGQDTMAEGCLSFQDISKDMFITGHITRPSTVKVKAQDENGAKVSLSLTDFQARIFQHEYDHLQGTLFHDRMNKEDLETAKPELIFMEKLFEKHHPNVQIQSVSQS
ncbi:Peptide deformylase 1B, chloroplastic [Trebouxia sp. C0010 RCD-2024]